VNRRFLVGIVRVWRATWLSFRLFDGETCNVNHKTGEIHSPVAVSLRLIYTAPPCEPAFVSDDRPGVPIAVSLCFLNQSSLFTFHFPTCPLPKRHSSSPNRDFDRPSIGRCFIISLGEVELSRIGRAAQWEQIQESLARCHQGGSSHSDYQRLLLSTDRSDNSIFRLREFLSLSDNALLCDMWQHRDKRTLITTMGIDENENGRRNVRKTTGILKQIAQKTRGTRNHSAPTDGLDGNQRIGAERMVPHPLDQGGGPGEFRSESFLFFLR
jgi:hypothetical protein